MLKRINGELCHVCAICNKQMPLQEPYSLGWIEGNYQEVCIPCAKRKSRNESIWFTIKLLMVMAVILALAIFLDKGGIPK
jgi:hypothetical protein